jgi:hypothetical protein
MDLIKFPNLKIKKENKFRENNNKTRVLKVLNGINGAKNKSHRNSPKPTSTSTGLNNQGGSVLTKQVRLGKHLASTDSPLKRKPLKLSSISNNIWIL